jgi:hypothetical protein
VGNLHASLSQVSQEKGMTAQEKAMTAKVIKIMSIETGRCGLLGLETPGKGVLQSYSINKNLLGMYP